MGHHVNWHFYYEGFGNRIWLVTSGLVKAKSPGRPGIKSTWNMGSIPIAFLLLWGVMNPPKENQEPLFNVVVEVPLTMKGYPKSGYNGLAVTAKQAKACTRVRIPPL